MRPFLLTDFGYDILMLSLLKFLLKQNNNRRRFTDLLFYFGRNLNYLSIKYRIQSQQKWAHLDIKSACASTLLYYPIFNTINNNNSYCIRYIFKMQKDCGDSSCPEKYLIFHDISTIYFKPFSSSWKTKFSFVFHKRLRINSRNIVQN